MRDYLQTELQTPVWKLNEELAHRAKSPREFVSRLLNGKVRTRRLMYATRKLHCAQFALHRASRLACLNKEGASK